MGRRLLRSLRYRIFCGYLLILLLVSMVVAVGHALWLTFRPSLLWRNLRDCVHGEWSGFSTCWNEARRRLD